MLQDDILEFKRTKDTFDFEFADEVAGIFGNGLFEVSVVRRHFEWDAIRREDGDREFVQDPRCWR